MSVLRLLNVESAYGPIRAIRGVSLEVAKGRIGTVLGSNGAGKTTDRKSTRLNSSHTIQSRMPSSA